MKKYEKKLEEFYDDMMDIDNDEFIDDEDINDEELTDTEYGYKIGYEDGYSDCLDHMGMNESVEIKEEELNEESEDDKAKNSIKGIIEKDWGGDNKEQYGAAQLIVGLSGNNSKIANDFMDDLNKLTDKMDLSKYGIEK